MSGGQYRRVREQDNSFAKRPSRAEFFREVGAPLVREKTLSGSIVTIERIERRGAGAVDWRYRQDRDALFYFERGVIACRGVLDGSGISRQLNGASRLGFLEAGSTIESEVIVPGRCTYWVAFIDRRRLLADEEAIMRCRLASRIGFENAALALAMNSLRTELSRNDDLSNLYLEAWAIQALVLLHRSSVKLPPQKAILSKIQISKVIDFMEENVGNDITLNSLAKLVDVSPRHLRRLFLATTGVAPSEMFTSIRLERAALDLRHSRKSVTEISLDCGFSQPQHLATAFRRKFGLTPTAFRQSAAS